MRLKICVFVCGLLSACTVVDSSSFKYLDAENLKLHPLLIIGAEQDVEISLPGNLFSKLPGTLFMQAKGLELPYTKALNVPYEWQWGGSAGKDQGLYALELAFSFVAGKQLFLKSAEDRPGQEEKQEEKVYADIETGPWRDDVLKKAHTSVYRSAQGYQWLLETLPAAKRHHESFSLPISNQHQLVAWFWYDQDWLNAHPGWYQRRKALSRRILDSVRLTARS